MAPSTQGPGFGFRFSRPKERAPSYFASLRTRAYHDGRNASNGSHAIRSLSWNAPGTRIATAHSNHSVRVWNPEKTDIKYTTELRGHVGGVNSVDWDPAHADKLCSTSSDSTVRLWDYRVNRCAGSIPLGGGTEGKEVHYHPDRETMLVSTRDHGIKVLDGKTMSVVGHSFYPPSMVNEIIFAHSGTFALLALERGEVGLYSFPSFDLIYKVPAHPHGSLSLAIDPRGVHMACGGADAVTGIWDTADWINLRVLRDMEYPITSVSFTFDGVYLASGSEEGQRIDVNHVDSGEEMHRINTSHSVTKLKWHPNRYWLAYSGDPRGLNIVGAAGPDK